MGIIFEPSRSMKISVLPEQEKQLSSKERIQEACTQKNVLAFDIYRNDRLIGFAMVRKFDKGQYFLWNYAIDYHYHIKHYGTEALVDFISFMKNTYGASVITTTYLRGNEHAKHLYEKIGFGETDVVNEDGCHEVNMVYYC